MTYKPPEKVYYSKLDICYKLELSEDKFTIYKNHVGITGRQRASTGKGAPSKVYPIKVFRLIKEMREDKVSWADIKTALAQNGIWYFRAAQTFTRKERWVKVFLKKQDMLAADYYNMSPSEYVSTALEHYNNEEFSRVYYSKPTVERLLLRGELTEAHRILSVLVGKGGVLNDEEEGEVNLQGADCDQDIAGADDC